MAARERATGKETRISPKVSETGPISAFATPLVEAIGAFCGLRLLLRRRRRRLCPLVRDSGWDALSVGAEVLARGRVAVGAAESAALGVGVSAERSDSDG